jgi:hypothetical protein
VLQRYEDDGYPDRRGNRKWHTEEEKIAHPETRFLRNVRPFFDNIPHPDVCQDTFDKYKDLRVAQVKDGCDGLRMVDRELTTLCSQRNTSRRSAHGRVFRRGNLLPGTRTRDRGKSTRATPGCRSCFASIAPDTSWPDPG